MAEELGLEYEAPTDSAVDESVTTVSDTTAEDLLLENPLVSMQVLQGV